MSLKSPDPAPEKKELGFGNAPLGQARLINADGSYNYRKVGLSALQRFNIYNFLIQLSWGHFLFLIIIWYLFVNIIFAGLYMLAGPENLGGLLYSGGAKQFWEIFFFSAQTLTTVGYGRVNPVGMTTNILATSQLLLGMLNFSLITGLLYGRFAKPRSYIAFSEKILISPFHDQKALMFRLVNRQENNLTAAKVSIFCGINTVNAQGQRDRQFVSLKTERDEIAFLVSSWTIVHPLDADSPFAGLSEAEIIATDLEVFVLFSAYDELFNSTVHARKSYTPIELIPHAKFVRMAETSPTGQPIVRLDLLDDYNLLQ